LKTRAAFPLTLEISPNGDVKVCFEGTTLEGLGEEPQYSEPTAGAVLGSIETVKDIDNSNTP